MNGAKRAVFKKKKGQLGHLNQVKAVPLYKCKQKQIILVLINRVVITHNVFI